MSQRGKKSSGTKQTSPWSSKSSVGKPSQMLYVEVGSPSSATKSRSRNSFQGQESDSASMSADSPASRHSLSCVRFGDDFLLIVFLGSNKILTSYCYSAT